MEHPQTIAGLQRKRTEIAREVEIARQRLAELSHDLEAIERALAVFGVVDRRPTPTVYSFSYEPRELMRFILHHLREQGPSRSRQITLELMAQRGQDTADATLYEKVQKAVGKSLRRLEAHRAVSRAASDGGVVWSVNES